MNKGNNTMQLRHVVKCEKYTSYKKGSEGTSETQSRYTCSATILGCVLLFTASTANSISSLLFIEC